MAAFEQHPPIGADGLPPTLLAVIPDRSIVTTLGSTLAGSFDTTTTSASLGTVLTIGAATRQSGVLELCGITATGGEVTDAQLKITLDGVVIYDETATLSVGDIRNAAGSIGTTFGSSDKAAGVTRVHLPWEKSILIETKSDGVDTVHCFFDYHLT